jgi:membrane protease subunit HflC
MIKANRTVLARLAWALLVVLVAWRSLYVVEATEQVVRTRFGRPIEIVTDAGLHVRIPFVDGVTRLDKRLQPFDPPAAEFLTLDKKNLAVETFLLWRIADPKRFLETLAGREAAEARLADLSSSELAAALGTVPMSQLISAKPGEAKLSDLAGSVERQVRARAAEDYGIEVEELAVKRLGFPEQNLASVFERMRSERDRIARRLRSEGEEQALRIRAEAERDKAKLLADATRKAAETRGAGEAEAARLYAAAAAKDRELFRLIQALDAYEKMLATGTTAVLPADSPLLKVLVDGPPSAREPRK